jgi:membrane-associated protease RseP (regulator of RpoE activity)
MQSERCRNVFAWLTMVGLIMISGLSAQAGDDGQDNAGEKKPRTQVRELNVHTIDVDGQQSQQQVIVVEGEAESTGEKSAQALNLVEEEVLITTDDGGERSERVLRINAEPAGDVLTVRLADESQPQELELGKYWIGLQVNEVSPALRAQLNLEEGRGVLVGEVLPDSPASKAGVKQYDIVLAIGEHKVGANDDVLKAVKVADGKELKLTLLRGGSERSVSVTPAERPKRDVAAFAPKDAGSVATWIQSLNQLQPGAGAEWPNVQFDVVKPGQAWVLDDNQFQFRTTALPEDLSISITREGKAPAKIKIRQKEREIETTEDKLSELPEDLRRYVEPMLGRGRAAMSFGGARGLAPPAPRLRLNAKAGRSGDVLITPPPGAETQERRVRVLPPGGPEGVEKRLEALERRLDELQRAVRPADGGKADDTKQD